VLGLQACLQNAVSLVEDADILLDRGRISRGVALLVAALEELGKVTMIIGTNRMSSQADWSRFWKRFYSHEQKTVNQFLNADSFAGPIAELVLYFHTQRENCIYVDLRNGQWEVPEVDARFQPEDVLKLRSITLHSLEHGRKAAEAFNAEAVELMRRFPITVHEEGEPLDSFYARLSSTYERYLNESGLKRDFNEALLRGTMLPAELIGRLKTLSRKKTPELD
jgi:AbiV family abortive infection protein